MKLTVVWPALDAENSVTARTATRYLRPLVTDEMLTGDPVCAGDGDVHVRPPSTVYS